MIGELVDKYFPMRDENDNPTYRPNQRETIIKIVEAFQEGIKYVCLNGPVGCGKSAINYTAAMVLSVLGEPGSATYLTHQKQLQDQVVKERWPEVKMVKGRGAYACNGATILDNRIRCNYSGEKYETCHNSDKKIGFISDDEIISAISKIHRKYDDDERTFRMRTGFEHDEDLYQECYRIKSFVAGRIPEKSGPDDVLLSSCIGCNVAAQECPVKSTRLLAQMHKVRILNPDVFYMLNRGQVQYFPHSKLMIFDECHKIEDIIKRIFGGAIYVDFLKDYFGVDMSELYNCEGTEDFIQKYMHLMKTVVMPAKCAAVIMNHLAPLVNIKKMGASQKFTTLSKDDMVNDFVMTSRSLGNREIPFNMIEFLDSVFSDRNDGCHELLTGLWQNIRGKFRDMCSEENCVTTFTGFMDMCCHPDAVKSMHRIAWYTEAIDHLEDIVGLISIPGSFMFSSEKVDMRHEYKESEMSRFVSENIKDWKKAYMMSIRLTPINIPAMMRSFFYNKADHVILSTGTWICAEDAMKTFGVDMDSYRFINIPSTFDARRRPVYVMSGGHYMDFSEKINESPWYYYKTEQGSKEFTSQLSEVINSIRKYFNERNGLNINVIVHSFSFDIAKRIAKYCPDVDNSWLIQLAKNDFPIRNEMTGYSTSFVYKDELLQYIMNHPNSGLTFVSASVNEGVDFKYDIARAQVILKRPTPNIGDPYVKAQYKGNPTFNVPKDPTYLDRATYTDMMQMYGRIMRAQDDWGVTVIFDQAITKSFNTLLSSRGAWRVRNLGLDYFVSAIKGGVDRNGFPYFNWPF